MNLESYLSGCANLQIKLQIFVYPMKSEQVDLECSTLSQLKGI
jgi:hypothetical protein